MVPPDKGTVFNFNRLNIFIMNRIKLQTLLKDNNVPFASNATVTTLTKLAQDNNLIEESTDDDDTPVSIKLRPAPSPIIKNGVDFAVAGPEMSNVRWKYHRDYTTAAAREKRPDGFNAYLFKKGDIELPFIADARDEADFVKDFKNKEVHSLVLTSVVTGEMLPATAWDEAKPEVLYELNTIISKKDRAYYRDDAFKDFIFSPNTFISNPELLSKSGILEKIMEETV